MATSSFPLPAGPFPANPQRPSASPLQYNWLTGLYEFPPIPPRQLAFEFSEDESDSSTKRQLAEYVTLLASENGAQLFVSGFGISLGKKSERVVIKHKGKICAEVPFLKLQEIAIGSRGVSVTSDLIDAACERGMRIAFLTPSGKPYALLTSPLLTATVETRKAQFAAIAGLIGLNIARAIVAGKLRNQEKLLRYFARTREPQPRSQLLRAADSIRAIRKKALAHDDAHSASEARPTLMGLEGAAGRLYWEQWANILPDALAFDRREHAATAAAPNTVSPVNSALNYGYGLLTSHVWGAAMNAGLEPFAGFLHTNRSGKPSLALDLVEEFRQPVVDRAVFGWICRGGRPRLDPDTAMLDPRSREEVGARVIARLNATEAHRGKNHQIRSIIQMQARSCAAAVRGIRNYRPFPFTW